MTERQHAPVTPNNSIVTGTVIRTRETKIRGEPCSFWLLRIERAEDVPGLLNFARSYEGRTTLALTWPEFQPDISEQDGTISGSMQYRAQNGRRGVFVLRKREE